MGTGLFLHENTIPKPSFPIFSLTLSAPMGPWANAHGPMGDRPPPRGRSPTAPWAFAHRPVGVRPPPDGRWESQREKRMKQL